MYCAVDLGSTKTEILLFDAEFGLKGDSSFPTPFEHKAGVVSIDPEAYFEKILTHLAHLLSRDKGAPDEDFFCTVTGMGSTILATDRAGRVLIPALSWEYVAPGERPKDRPTSKTGKFLLPTYPLFKIPWIRDRCSFAEAVLLSLPDYVLASFTDFSAFSTDYSFASRSLLFDDVACDWDDEILAAEGIERKQLPVLGEAGTVREQVSERLRKRLGLGKEARVCLGMHDHAATGYLGSLLARDRGRILINPAGTTESILAWSGESTKRAWLVAQAPTRGVNTESAWKKNILALVTYPCLSGKIADTARSFGFDPSRLLEGKPAIIVAPPRRRLRVEDRGFIFPETNGPSSLDEFWRGLLLGAQFEFRMALEEFERLLGIGNFEKVFLFGGQGRDANLSGLKALTVGLPVYAFHGLNGAALGAVLKIADTEGPEAAENRERIFARVLERIVENGTEYLPDEGKVGVMDELYVRYRDLCEKASRKEKT